MRKQFIAGVVLTALLISGLFIVFTSVSADTASPWISSPLLLVKQNDTNVLPLSLNGNIDCSLETSSDCAVPTAYGAATQNSTVRLNGSSDYKPVYSYIEDRPRFLPVPNSNTFITYTSEPVYGLYYYFNYNLSSSISLTTDFRGSHYKLNRAPDAALADKTSHRLAADYTSMSFSENGQWMVVSSPNLATLRVNLQTFEVLPFAAGFNYTLGIDPALKTAITNDGRYVSVASAGFSSWKVYDLNTCSTVPNTIIGPAGCQSRDLAGFAKPQITGYTNVVSTRFIDDSSIASYLSYKDGNITKIARFIVSNQAIVNQIQYLAMGDSYIVGEGAFDYQGGTDTSQNKCHLSYLAYPYLIGHDLNYDSYHSVACSGAVTGDITDNSIPFSKQNEVQAKGKDDPSFDDEIYSGFFPGYRAQMNFVKRYQPKIITLSVGGNDMGFSDIVIRCVDPRNLDSCYSTYEERQQLVHLINTSVYNNLLKTYDAIKRAGTPDMRIYVIGYPQIAKPGGNCAVNVRLNEQEIEFSQQLINYLDLVIQTAAIRSGVYYVDAQNALDGFRLCEAGPGKVAINGLTAGNDKPTRIGGPIGDESYHPNALGYQLLENKILGLTHNLTNPMPAQDSSVNLPNINSLQILNIPHSGQPVKTTEFEPGLAPDLAFQQVPINITVNGAEHSLSPGSSLTAELHSDVISLGTYNTDSFGDLSARVTIPANSPTGYHTLHFYGTDLTGQPIDIYKYIYVAHTADDLDGDGLLDSAEKCVEVPPANQDFDQDGIDDGCDANITLPPAAPSSLVSGSIKTTVSSLSESPYSSTVGSQSNSNLTNGEITSDKSNQTQPMVLGAKTEAQISHSLNKSRAPNYYFSAAVLSVFVLLVLAYAVKSWLF